jgi:flagellar assembly protein FliH
MAVIKSHVAAASNAIAFSMADIESQARVIIARARQQAEQLLAEAQRQGEALRQQAHAEGLAAGFEEGVTRGLEEGKKLGHAKALEENNAQMSASVAALDAATTELNDRRRQLDSEALKDVVGLSLKVASRLTKREARFDPAVLMANLGECLRLVVGTHDIRVAIHPSQKATLADAMLRLKLQFAELQHVELTEDESVAPGGCRIFTRQGQIDADLDAQLQRIARELIPGDEESESAAR